MKKQMAGMSVLAAVLTFTAWTSAALVNVAPDATYSYLTGWPGTPGIIGDGSCTKLNNNTLTDLALESSQEPLVAVFDLGADMAITKLAVFSMQNDWGTNCLDNVVFCANTEAQGAFTNYYGGGSGDIINAGWSSAGLSVDTSNTTWVADTGVFTTPVTARYVALIASAGGPWYSPAVSEVAIYVPEPVTIALLAVGGIAGLRRRL